MDATPPEKFDETQTAQARRAQRILMLAMATMIALPVLLFYFFHLS